MNLRTRQAGFYLELAVVSSSEHLSHGHSCSRASRRKVKNICCVFGNACWRCLQFSLRVIAKLGIEGCASTSSRRDTPTSPYSIKAHEISRISPSQKQKRLVCLWQPQYSKSGKSGKTFAGLSDSVAHCAHRLSSDGFVPGEFDPEVIVETDQETVKQSVRKIIQQLTSTMNDPARIHRDRLPIIGVDAALFLALFRCF